MNFFEVKAKGLNCILRVNLIHSRWLRQMLADPYDKKWKNNNPECMKPQTSPIPEDVLPKCVVVPNGCRNIDQCLDNLCEDTVFGSAKFEMSMKLGFFKIIVL